jgi:hypothetical protein
MGIDVIPVTTRHGRFYRAGASNQGKFCATVSASVIKCLLIRRATAMPATKEEDAG